ncbi:MAG TPA: hypothetical protein PK747_08155 [Acidobacteriota bacterium]|nr:hypothetical protein [Acidobacteriota bacterium]HQO20515.1 hypothetical protein [Acidobacteriota bacterium]HQQ47365.1 hypothetical protein [Acidobacteriota bacterium]
MKCKRQLLILFTIFLAISIFSFAQERWIHKYSSADKVLFGFTSDFFIPFLGGYLGTGVAGGGPDTRHPLYVWRADSHGNIMWVKELVSDFGWDTQLLDNGDETFSVVFLDGLTVVNCDSSGNVLSSFGYFFGSRYSANTADGEIDVLTNSGMGRFDRTTGDTVFVKGYLPLTPDAPFIEGYGYDKTTGGGYIMAGNIFADALIGSTVLKLDSDGNLLWAKIYETNIMESKPIVAATKDGGFVLSHKYLTTESYVRTPLMRMDNQGNILWQEELVYPEHPQMTSAKISGLKECENGTILVWGFTGEEQDNPISGTPFMATLNSDGAPMWSNIYWFLNERPPSMVEETEKGYVLVGYDNGAALFTRVDNSGNLTDECTYYISAINMNIIETSFSSSDAQFTMIDGNQPYPLQGEYSSKDIPLKDIVSCGETWPAVLSVQKASNPFRLKLTGWNFQQGSEVYVNGVKAGKVMIKGTDSYNRTKIVVKGSDFKALLPKGQPVCITVKNPDGHESDCFTFTR